MATRLQETAAHILAMRAVDLDNYLETNGYTYTIAQVAEVVRKLSTVSNEWDGRKLSRYADEYFQKVRRNPLDKRSI